MLTGNSGILKQAQRAKTETDNAQAEEEKILANYESYLNSYSGENTEFTDSLGNKVVVPAGFRVVNPEDNVEDGIVIEDVAHGATAGSQFVWIPVGESIKKSDGTTFDITLERYEFDNLTGKPNIYTGIYKEGSYGNVEAKDIETFVEKVTKTGGYYLARYEARTLFERKNKEQELKQITVKPNDFVYNYVTQSQAADKSRNMYDNEFFDSDLVNSYAWDTAILFIQKCSGDADYSIQTSLNTSLANKGTNNTEFEDKRCNIFDMASNCYEWTTETSTYVSVPCISRGGSYNDMNNFTSRRNNNSSTRSEEVPSFRPIIYL